MTITIIIIVPTNRSLEIMSVQIVMPQTPIGPQLTWASLFVYRFLSPFPSPSFLPFSCFFSLVLLLLLFFFFVLFCLLNAFVVFPYYYLFSLQCSGVHRSLGSHVSKVRSIHLDDWLPETVEVMRSIGNSEANQMWENQLPGAEAKPAVGSTREVCINTFQK